MNSQRIFDPKNDELVRNAVLEFFCPVSDEGFEKIDGHDELKQQLLEVAADPDFTRGYLFYGHPGTGKTCFIHLFAGELKKQNYQFMRLRGSDLHAQLVTITEKLIAAAFTAAREHEPCLLFVDDIDYICVSRDDRARNHEKRLTTAFLEAYRQLVQSGKRVILVGATNHPGVLDEELVKQTTLIKVPLPGKKERILFFNKHLFKLIGVTIPLEDGFTVEEMADATEEYGYVQLKHLHVELENCVSAQIIEACAVYNQAGQRDVIATGRCAEEAIRSGHFKITREIFHQALQNSMRPNRIRISQELKAFEERFSKCNN